jgi:hypothetical protein
MRILIKLLVGIGTAFIENEHECTVTRVTDLDFDTLDKITGNVKIRSLQAWESERFLNSISGCTGLLKMPDESKKAREWLDKQEQV